MRVKKAFEWNRTYSAIPGGITIPAGTEVELRMGTYFVHPLFFDSKSIEYHDAYYYGCRVDRDNVEE
jgi:hypothetical protein